MSRIFRQFGLDDGVVGQLPERFESYFKAVQSEQRQVHNQAVVTPAKQLNAKSFSEATNADGLEVADHAA